MYVSENVPDEFDLNLVPLRKNTQQSYIDYAERLRPQSRYQHNQTFDIYKLTLS